MSQEHEVAGEDPYRWLEDVTGTEALDWVRERNAESLGRLSGSTRFTGLRTEIREVLDADDRIPFVRRRGEYLYNFWQDATHPRGLWRRTTLEEYRRDRPDWEILLDVDALAAEEEENWVWQGAEALRPGGYRLALLHLSRGGADASVVREFNVAERRFAEDGFAVAEAKTDVGWIDADRIYVGTDFGPGSLTSSGYPRLVKEWRRGTPLAQAETVYEGKPDDVGVHAFHDPTEGFERDFVLRNIEFFRTEWWLRTGTGDLVQVAVPEDAIADVHREWLLVQTRSPWSVGGATYPAGVLLAARFDAFLAGDRELTVLFEPAAGGSGRSCPACRSSPTPTWWTPTPTTATSTCWNPPGSPSPARCVTGASAGRWRRSSRRRRSSTPRRSGCGSSSPPRRTAPPSPISWSGPASRAPGRSCSPGTAASRSH